MFNAVEGETNETSNNEQSKSCEACGHGFAPDERMNFTGMVPAEIMAAAYDMLTQAQLQLSSAECCLAKLMEINKNAKESPI